jgi:hypothetical protein
MMSGNGIIVILLCLVVVALSGIFPDIQLYAKPVPKGKMRF